MSQGLRRVLWVTGLVLAGLLLWALLWLALWQVLRLFD